GRGGLVDGEQEQGNAVVGERLHRGRGAGELGRQQARLRGHQLRRGGDVVARRGALFRASAGPGGGRFGLGFGLGFGDLLLALDRHRGGPGSGGGGAVLGFGSDDQRRRRGAGARRAGGWGGRGRGRAGRLPSGGRAARASGA